jgi:ubiquinone/menaquinone biosynthesis C-methylase UbiE
MLSPKKYWQNIKLNNFNAAPNVSLFRFLGEYGFKFKRKKVLEIGFFHGADLIEFNKRKSKVYGIDINKKAVQLLKKKINTKNIKQSDARNELIPFKDKFDLIYSRDFIYYLNKKEIFFHFENVFKSLKKGGLYLFQFIEKDLIFKKNYVHNYNLHKKKCIKTFAKKNPIKFYKLKYFKKVIKKFNLQLVGRKFLIESYGINENKVRINKYLLTLK